MKSQTQLLVPFAAACSQAYLQTQCCRKQFQLFILFVIAVAAKTLVTIAIFVDLFRSCRMKQKHNRKYPHRTHSIHRKSWRRRHACPHKQCEHRLRRRLP